MEFNLKEDLDGLHFKLLYWSNHFLEGEVHSFDYVNLYNGPEFVMDVLEERKAFDLQGSRGFARAVARFEALPTVEVVDLFRAELLTGRTLGLKGIALMAAMAAKMKEEEEVLLGDERADSPEDRAKRELAKLAISERNLSLKARAALKEVEEQEGAEMRGFIAPSLAGSASTLLTTTSPTTAEGPARDASLAVSPATTRQAHSVPEGAASPLPASTSPAIKALIPANRVSLSGSKVLSVLMTQPPATPAPTGAMEGSSTPCRAILPVSRSEERGGRGEEEEGNTKRRRCGNESAMSVLGNLGPLGAD